MWGSSNPDTEDNWWFDYLHNTETVEQIKLGSDPYLDLNAHYFLQPSGMSDIAENLENLPGGRRYYENLIKGKATAWIKQFVDAEWGYSAAGKPVIPSFNADLHVSKKPMVFNPNIPLIVGLDPGLTGSACIFGQQDMHGRLYVLGECVQSGFGATRLAQEVIRPYIYRRFPGAKLIIAPDPAANNRTPTDERTVVDVLKQFWPVDIESNNRLPLRLDAIEYFTSRLVEGGPALVVDVLHCPVLIRALKGGWRYTLDKKKGGIKGAEPEDNPYTHPGDAFGYLCRYFHRNAQRDIRYGSVAFKPPIFKNNYSFR